MHYPIPFSDPQKRSSLKLLAFFHIFILTISNFLVQRTFEITVPFTDYVIPTTWGTFTFPFIFLATDLTVRVFGAEHAKLFLWSCSLPY